MNYERDSSELAKAIRSYSPEGYIVNVRGVGRGTIGEVLQEYKTTTIYRVWLKDPQVFEEYADARHASAEKLSPEGFRSKYRQMANYFPDEMIERGLSDLDVMHWELENSGCLDSKGRVACLTVDWEFVDIIGFKRGMMVEYAELVYGETAAEGTGGRRVWPGRIAGTTPAAENPEGEWPIALLEVFEPIPYYRTPQAINNLAVKPGYYSNQVHVLAKGLYKVIKNSSPELLPERGQWSDDKQEFYLEQPMDVSVIKELCAKLYPKQPRCLLQGLTFYVLPLNVGEAGEWKPLRRTRLEEYESTTLVQMDIDSQIRESSR